MHSGQHYDDELSAIFFRELSIAEPDYQLTVGSGTHAEQVSATLCGVADVIVCSGYVGNVVIKMLEGVSQTVLSLARYAYKEKLLWRAALAMMSSGIQRLKQITDWQQYGGAPLLGFNNLFIKAHGRSKARAVTNAIKVADKALTAGLCQNIAGHLNQLEARTTAS